jgi:hypothetical protein
MPASERHGPDGNRKRSKRTNSSNVNRLTVGEQRNDIMNFIESYKPQRSAFWKATLLFILVAGLLIAADQLSIRYGLEGSQRILDDLLGGLIASSVFYLYERHRLRRLSEQLHVIDLMNHHIRNALQPLMFVPDESEEKPRMKVVEECVRRIDWALREVLPGKSAEQFVAPPADSLEEVAKDRVASSSSETKRSQPEPTNSEPKPLFSQWLYTSRSRNEGVRQ